MTWIKSGTQLKNLMESVRLFELISKRAMYCITINLLEPSALKNYIFYHLIIKRHSNTKHDTIKKQEQ